MLIDFSITNYKSIKGTVHLNTVYNTNKSDKELDKICNYDNHIDFFKVPSGNGNNHIKVCPVMALFGANASGKSNILKAFLAIRAIVSNGYSENFYTPFKFSSETENAPTTLEITFSSDGDHGPHIYTYGIKYSEHRIEQEYLKIIGKTEDTVLYDTDDFDTIPRGMWQEFITRRKPIANLYFDDAHNGEIPGLEGKTELCKDGLDAVKDFFNKLVIADDINLASISAPIDDPEKQDEGEIFKEYRKQRAMFETVKSWLFRMDMSFYDIGIEGTEDDDEELSKYSLERIEDIEKAKRYLEEKYPDDLVIFDIDGDSRTFKRYKINMKYKKDRGDDSVLINYVKDESTGTKNLFRFLFVLIEALQKGQTIIFDEIDRTIHTELLKFLFGVVQATNLNKYGAQMICSSHNPCIIATVGVQGTMLVTKKSDLSTCVRFLSEYKYKYKDVTVLEDYLNGRFGAIPNVIYVFETMEVPNA